MIPRRLRTALLAALLLASPVAAGEWQYESGPVPIAWFDNGQAQFQFACRGGDFTMGFWVRAPHRQVASAGSMNLAIVPDPATEADAAAMTGASFAQDMPLIHSDGTSMIVMNEGKVTEALPNGYFRVDLSNGHKVLAHLSGRIAEIEIVGASMTSLTGQLATQEVTA